MRIIAIGKARDSAEATLFARYALRIRPALTLTELPDGRGAPAEVKRRESETLLAALPANPFVIALDLAGDALDTPRFAAQLDTWLASGRPVTFLIGGAEGLDRIVIARADRVLSLGPMTWPHLLARAMLAEQIYRARSLSAGHPYHRAGRPS